MKEERRYGHFPQKETHESRSSSMSYAMHWKPENLRRISVISLFVIAAVVTLIGLNSQDKKNVALAKDGEMGSVETQHSLMNEVLDEHSILLNPEDKVSSPLAISVVRAVPVKLTVDGTTKTHFTTQKDVEGAIKELGVSLDPIDKITPALSSELKSNLEIRIVRVNKQLVQTQEAVPFTIVKTSDPDLLKGKTKVIQQGSKGLVTHNIEKVYEDGIFVSKQWLGKEVSKTAQPKVIAVGTKKPTAVLSASITRTGDKVDISGLTTKGGVSFKYKKVLKNVTLTAYSAEEDGIGTKTASGTRVKEGRTIAVDKSVVPMGWWVYIEGVGFRRAEDTGGAIKGNKMDVYYDSLKAANQFGRKKGRTVYVIGPTKPELN